MLDASRRAVLPLVPRRPAQHLLQRARPPRRGGRGDQPALIYDSPVTGTVRDFTYRELRDEVARFAGALCAPRRREGRPGRHLHADGPRGGDRHAGLRAARRGALGGVRRLRAARAGDPHRRRRTRRSSSRPRAASSGKRVIEYKPLLDRAIEHRRPQARALRHPAAARRRTADLGADRDLDWHEAIVGSRSPADCVPVARHRPAVHPLHLGHHGQAEGRRARQRRPRGRAGVDAWPNIYDIGPGDVFWAASDVGWVVGHSYIVYAPLLTGARPCSTRASRSARPTPARSGE